VFSIVTDLASNSFISLIALCLLTLTKVYVLPFSADETTKNNSKRRYHVKQCKVLNNIFCSYFVHLSDTYAVTFLGTNISYSIPKMMSFRPQKMSRGWYKMVVPSKIIF
jgi:hypothetical protein